MKKHIAIAVLAIFATISSFATNRKKVAEYAVNGLHYNIEAEYTGNGQLSIYIETLGEYEGSFVLLNIQGEENINKFASEMANAKGKFSEWKKIAAKNDITEYKKAFSFDAPDITVCWPRRSDKTRYWYSDTDSANFTPMFRVVKSPVYGVGYYFVVTNRVESVENSYVSTKYTLAFSREKDIEMFVKALDTESIKSNLDNAIEKDAHIDELFN